jgi:hypothetical protein
VAGPSSGATADQDAPLSIPEAKPFLTWAQIARRDLRRIGVAATIHAFPLPVLSQKLDQPGEPWDLAFQGAFGPDYPDPASVLILFDGPPTPLKYRRLLHRAERLSGARRYRLFGRLDVILARDVAPTVPFASLNLKTFVSARIGCKIFNPGLDLAAVCLRR